MSISVYTNKHHKGGRTWTNNFSTFYTFLKSIWIPKSNDYMAGIRSIDKIRIFEDCETTENIKMYYLICL